MVTDRDRINEAIALFYDGVIDGKRLALMVSYYLNNGWNGESIISDNRKKDKDRRK